MISKAIVGAALIIIIGLAVSAIYHLFEAHAALGFLACLAVVLITCFVSFVVWAIGKGGFGM